MDKKDLFLFTAEFPHGFKSETFLENEIEVLCKHFNNVCIFPSVKNDSNQRKLPSNARVFNVLTENRGYSRKSILINHFWTFVNVFVYTVIISPKRVRYFMKWKYLADVLFQSFHKSFLIQSWIESTNYSAKDCIFYDYWFENSTPSLVLLKRKGIIKKLICRAHRFDLYDDEHETRVNPFGEFKLKYIDAVFACSSHGRIYLQNRYPRFNEKMKLSYLGVVDRKPLIIAESGKKKTIVSCARLVKFKRVLKMPEVLQGLSTEIRWIHFGSGPLEEELLEKVKTLPPNIEFDYKGHVSNNEVIEFYKNNFVDVFVSLSNSEGLPVSMMEAISFGIPILSTSVCGVPELVNNTTGRLVDHDASVKEIAMLLKEMLDECTFDRNAIYNFYLDNFEAGKNYNKFVKDIAKFK